MNIETDLPKKNFCSAQRYTANPYRKQMDLNQDRHYVNFLNGKANNSALKNLIQRIHGSPFNIIVYNN